MLRQRDLDEKPGRSNRQKKRRILEWILGPWLWTADNEWDTTLQSEAM